MDPTASLVNLILACHHRAVGFRDAGERLEQVQDSLTALCDWIDGGGFLPSGADAMQSVYLRLQEAGFFVDGRVRV